MTGGTEGQVLAEDAHTNRTHVAHFEDLAVTETSGWWRDFEFRRKYQLGSFHRGWGKTPE